MLSAKRASNLTEEMFCSEGDIRIINRSILEAIKEGKPHTYVEGDIGNSVLAHYVDLGYEVMRVVMTKADGSFSYKYMINW